MTVEISGKFAALREKGEGALIAYVMAGDPTPEATPKIVRALVRGGADLVELGMPFSDPVADGPTIQAAGGRALEAGMNPGRYFELVAGLEVDVPLICMTYYNLIFHYGPEAFVKKCRDSGISGIIVPDLPVEEAGELTAACGRHSVAPIFLIAPTTPENRVERVLSEAGGFIYLLSRLGVTGAHPGEIGASAKALLARVGTNLPKAVGFGVSTAGQAEALIRAGADAVIVGSAFVNIIASNQDPEEREELEKQLEALARELKTGIRNAAGAAAETVPESGQNPELPENRDRGLENRSNTEKFVQYGKI